MDVLGHGGRNVDADSVDGGSDIDGWVEPACPEQWLVGPHSRPQVDLVASAAQRSRRALSPSDVSTFRPAEVWVFLRRTPKHKQ